ncbi:HNH endonuclease [endosymbiont 'TC1' of Trimyema compressum]|uniref:HNH endonuclease n=1 Tax=endosymbiont 'TC1' of Trimyema compressum TaxID=243899 RepID=UPI000B4C7354|nr:HNH endonuclease [endosymbiont 'TC1' of Trimyema compressum]
MEKICLKCCDLVVKGSNYCEKHRPKNSSKTQNDKEYRKLKNKIYGSKKWRRLREKIFIRDLFTCQMCGAKAEEVHHIISLHEDESKAFDKNNLMSICRECHINFHRSEKFK